MILKVAVILVAALLASTLMRRSAAATRHAVLAAGQIAVLTLPLFAFVVPPITIAYEPLAPRRGDWTAPALSETVTAAPPTRSSIDSMSWAWLAGFLAVGIVRLTSYTRAAAVVARAVPWAGVLLSDEVTQPATSFSRIVLPTDARSWSADRLRAVLLHEGAHVSRRDTAFEILSDAVCAVYWFNPLAWLAAARARLERERACDDAVLAQGIAPVEYATVLVDVARNFGGHGALGAAMAERTHLEQRVRSILDVSVPRRAGRGARGVVFATVLAAAPLLSALTTLAISRPQSGEPDLRGDAVASPFSEYIGAPAADPTGAGPDAALIATMRELTGREPRSPIDFVADRARWALGRAREGRLIEPLIASLDDPDWRVRAYAAWALGYSADARSTGPVSALLEDKVWRVRAAAAHAILNLGDPAAASKMEVALSDDAWQVRSQAVRYFAAIGASRQLFETMRSDRHIAVRDAAEEALR